MLESILENLKDPSFLSLFFAYLGGVLASLTPCVYPLVPIVLGVIGAAKIQSKRKGFALSLVYALGLSVVYSALGMVAALTGSFFGEVATSPWSFLMFGILCILLAFWMLDKVTIPSFGTNKVSSKHGYIGVFITGMLSGLVAVPCTSAVLGVLLLYVSTTKSIFFGGAMLFSFSLGMTTILIIIGTFSGVLKTLPKPGAWMVTLKRVLAFILIGFGGYFLIKAVEGFFL